MLLECRPVIKDCSRCHFKPLVRSLIHQQTQSLAVKIASKNMKHRAVIQLFLPPPHCWALSLMMVIHTSTLASEDFIPGHDIYSTLMAFQWSCLYQQISVVPSTYRTRIFTTDTLTLCRSSSDTQIHTYETQ